MLLQALLYGLAASSALVIGAVLGSYLKVPRRLVAAMLAFASGSLTAALAFELFSEAFRQGGVSWSGLGFILGASVFAVTDAFLDRYTNSGGEESAFALLAGVTLDGVPENIALGITLLQSSGGGVVGLHFCLRSLLLTCRRLSPAWIGSRVRDARKGSRSRYGRSPVSCLPRPLCLVPPSSKR